MKEETAIFSEDRGGWEKLLDRYKIPLGIGLMGMILVGLGILLIGRVGQAEDKIEIVSSEQQGPTRNILVDIEGEVLKPGVYELPLGSHLDSLLVAAGGLSGDADRDWAEKNLNRAQKLSDGMKFYIPKKSEEPHFTEATQGRQESKSGININTATVAELDTLPGIGPITAQKIIENRPYQSTEDLLTKKIVSRNVYSQIVTKLTIN